MFTIPGATVIAGTSTPGISFSGAIPIGGQSKALPDTIFLQNDSNKSPASPWYVTQLDATHYSMLNAGLLGGSRTSVMAIAHGIIRLYYHIESFRFWGQESSLSAVGDLMAFGVVAHRFSDRLVTGPCVHTVFKSEGIGKECAWWKHK